MEIGKRIRELRLHAGLTQEELANRTDLTKGFISQVENDATSPSITTLEDIAGALGITMSKFFLETLVEEKVVFTKDDRVISGESEGKFELTFLIPQAHLHEMEPIMVCLEPGGETELTGGHEGEEFGYVLSGQVKLVLGDNHYMVRKGECFYFFPNADHKIVNEGKRSSEILWIATPPSF